MPILQGVAATLTGIAPPTAGKGGEGSAAARCCRRRSRRTRKTTRWSSARRRRCSARSPSVIRQLDVRRAQVLIEAVIAEVADQTASEIGVQWQLPFKKNADGSVARQRHRRHQLHRHDAGQQHHRRGAESARRRQRFQPRLHQRHDHGRPQHDLPARRAGDRAAGRRQVEHPFDAVGADARQPGSRDQGRAGSAVPDRPVHDQRARLARRRPAAARRPRPASPIRSRRSSARTSASCSR